MIYLGFVFDFIISSFLPINSYFVVSDLDDNNIYEVIVIGILLDTLLGHFIWNTIILLVLYGLTRLIQVKRKYIVLKNIIVFSIYFSIMNLLFGSNKHFLFYYLVSLLIQLLYFYVSNLVINGRNHHIM